MPDKLTGLIAATYTPLNGDGSLNLAQAEPIVEHLVRSGVRGLYVAGSTGEGLSLTTEERMAVAEAFVRASAGRLPVAIQVGHNSLAECRLLASHAQEIGADIISANATSYFKISTVDCLVDCMAEIASAAPRLPFYYYHIPAFTGAAIDMEEFLALGGERIPNLRGIKFTDLKLFEYQACLAFDDGRYDILWGCDEMLLSALAVGGRGAIGSTFNIAAPLYNRIIEAFDRGDMEEARRLQLLSVRMVQVVAGRHGALHPSMKAIMKMIGLDCGPCRLPQTPLRHGAEAAIRRDLDAIGFFEWALASQG